MRCNTPPTQAHVTALSEAEPSKQQPRDNAKKRARRDLHKQVALNLTVDLIE
jgi:hypothetical protein